MKKLIFIAVLFFISPSIFAETKYPDAPLGLKWGMTVKELKSKAGDVIAPTIIDKYATTYALMSAPIKLPGFSYHFITVHNDYGLMKIDIFKSIFSDKYNDKGKAEYFKYKKALINKYGEPDFSSECLTNDSEQKYFKSKHCNNYTSFLGGNLILLLTGIERNVGCLSIVYQSELFAKYEKEKTIEDENNIKNGL